MDETKRMNKKNRDFFSKVAQSIKISAISSGKQNTRRPMKQKKDKPNCILSASTWFLITIFVWNNGLVAKIIFH